MRSSMLLLGIVASGAQAQVSPKSPITVTGHRWAPFISPMGEPFRARTPTDDTLADWFAKADRNHDGVLTASEMVADAERFFATLDTNHDGQIDPDELAQYEYDIAPDVQAMSKAKRAPGQPSPVIKRPDSNDEDGGSNARADRDRHRDRDEEFNSSLGIGGALQGAARYGLLNMPEPVAAADTDFNRAITLEEFRAAALTRFELLDKMRQGKLTLAELEAMRPALPSDRHHQKRDANAPDVRIGNPLPPGH